MQRTCTCAFRRVLSATPDLVAQRTSSRAIPPITSFSTTTTRFRRSFSAATIQQYPRQATPFSSYKPSSDEVDVLEAAPEASSSSAKSAGTEASTSKSASSAWYLSETPASSSSTTSSTSTSTSKAPKEIPTPPSALPSYLRPLWDHMYESPFLDQHTINFIDSNAVQENVSTTNMDASVSSWVDWVVVASLRRGRERGIRGASEGAKIAMKECLKIFDTQLALAEQEQASSTPSTSPPIKRKSKIPKVLIEGLEIREPQWCLIDGSKAVVHIMTANARQTWQVEGVASGFSEVKRDRTRLGELANEEVVFNEEDERDDEDYDYIPPGEDLSYEDYLRDLPENKDREAQIRAEEIEVYGPIVAGEYTEQPQEEGLGEVRARRLARRARQRGE